MEVQKYLSDNEIVEVIKGYLENNIYNYAVMIDGDWGSGKTYFIKNTLVNHLEKYLESKPKESTKFKKIIYSSLYGITSTLDISNTIYINILNSIIESNDTTKKISKFINDNKIGKLASKIGSDILKNKGVDITQSLELLGEAININDYIFIFDDLERCNCDINEVLGYINNFVEHDFTKVILVANETEIGKCNESQNIELKYLLACQSEICYENLNNLDNSDTKKALSIDEVKNRANQIFNQNILYNKIKEKLIGITIKYQPDIVEIHKELINKNIKHEKLKEYLLDNLNNNIDFAIKKQHINLRTYQYFLSKINILNEYIEENYKDKYIQLIEIVVKYSYRVSILYKSGQYKYNWKDENLYGQVEVDYAKNILGFKFIDDYLIYSKLDKDEIYIAINSYLSMEEQQKSDPNEPYRKYQDWWEFEEQDIRKGIGEIIQKLKANKYNLNDFPILIKYFISLEEVGFEKDILDEIVNIMNNIIDNLDEHAEMKDYYSVALILDKESLKRYNEIINTMKEKLNSKRDKREEDVVNECINDIVLWGENLYTYAINNEDKPLAQRSFFNKINIEKLKENIKLSNCKNLTYFRWAILSLYNFTNIKDYYTEDRENIKCLLEYINGIIDSSEFDLIKRRNLKLLLELLQEKYQLLI